MTREEIRRAFRQAPQEEFATLPWQPVIHASPKFRHKMEHQLGLAFHPISHPGRTAVLLLAALLLCLGWAWCQGGKAAAGPKKFLSVKERPPLIWHWEEEPAGLTEKGGIWNILPAERASPWKAD